MRELLLRLVKYSYRSNAVILLIIIAACKPEGEYNTERAAAPTEDAAIRTQLITDPAPDTVEGMVWIGGGVIEQGGQKMEIAGFYIDSTEVTVAEFRRFIEATDYQTEAESYGWSGVFNRNTQRWEPVEGATWQYPEGPDQPKAADNEPVTQVSWKDAVAYAEWVGKRLPSETEWLWAATQRGQQQYFNWGNELLPNGKYPANWWQGVFPYEDTGDDGFLGVAPVASFPPDAQGLYDIAGNVWEWTTDRRYPSDTNNPNPEMVIKGGSFLCADNYCAGYELASRQFTPKDSGLDHLGFRCVR